MNMSIVRQKVPSATMLAVMVLVAGAADVIAAQAAQQETGAVDTSAWPGLRIMEEVHARHRQFPYVYEEQSLLLIDRNGRRDIRKVRRYSRVEDDGTVRLLLLFDSPVEVKGVALLAARSPEGTISKYVYLPALAEQLIESSGASADSDFLGTDFSVEDLTGEQLDDYVYVRRLNARIDEMRCFVIDVYDPGVDLDETQPLRRHFVRQDNFYITMTEHFDNQGRIYKRLTHHDVKAVDGRMWRAGMLLMADEKEQHQSLIKIHRRVFSRDYVPEEIFSAEWLFQNHPHRTGQSADDESAGEKAEHTADPGAAEVMP